MTIRESHVRVAENADRAIAIDGARLQENVGCLAAMRARVHAKRSANGAGNATVKRQSVDARLRGGARETHVGNRRAHAQAMVGQDGDFPKRLAPKPDDDAGHAAVAHDQVRAKPDGSDGNVAGKTRHEIGEIILVGG